MPSGNVHSVATTAGAITLAFVMAGAEFSTPEILATFGGYMTTLVVNPDLDLNTRRPRKFLPWMWWIFWYPYSRSVKHRSPFSHWPVIGTLLRVTYLSIFIFLLTLITKIEYNVSHYYYFFAGMVISDTMHFLMDWSVTGLKKSIKLR